MRLNRLTERQKLDDTLTVLSTSDCSFPSYVSSAWTMEGVPATGDNVWARVMRVTPRFVDVDMLLSEPGIGDRLYATPYRGTIKTHDIREYAIDTINPLECFRPGDTIRATVTSTGDSRGGYLLTTTPVHCGVVFGTSTSGGRLIPISHQLMRCSKTGAIEPRKVARPD